MRQAVALISHLINEAGRKPENLILVGDSTSANLILGVISHMLHPHPDACISPLRIDTPLKGALLVSPWTHFNPVAASYTTDQKRDFVNEYILAKWGPHYIRTTSPDAYNQPGTAIDNLWQEIDTKLRGVAITAGGMKSCLMISTRVARR
jgi:acetyl esterase/lipase